MIFRLKATVMFGDAILAFDTRSISYSERPISLRVNLSFQSWICHPDQNHHCQRFCLWCYNHHTSSDPWYVIPSHRVWRHNRSPHKTIIRYEFSGLAKYGSLETPQPVVSMIMNDTHTLGFALYPSDAWHRVPSHVRDTGMHSNLLLPTQTSSPQNATFEPHHAPCCRAPSFIALTSTSKALEAYSNDEDDDDIRESVTPIDDDKPNWVCLGLGSSSASTTIRLSAYHSFIVMVSDPSRTRWVVESM